MNAEDPGSAGERPIRPAWVIAAGHPGIMLIAVLIR